jgi:hypothetical protein
MADSAVMKFIGEDLAVRVLAILAMLASRFSAMAPVQAASGLSKPVWSIAANSAEIVEPISPARGASMGTLESISWAEISICTKVFCAQSLWSLPPQVGPLPCESSQFRRAPISMTQSASFSAWERAAMAACGWLSGSRPLAMDMAR